jgi:hypothetical protein
MIPVAATNEKVSSGLKFCPLSEDRNLLEQSPHRAIALNRAIAINDQQFNSRGNQRFLHPHSCQISKKNATLLLSSYQQVSSCTIKVLEK